MTTLPTYTQEDGSTVEPEALRLAFSGSDDSFAHALRHNEPTTLIVRVRPGAVAFKTDSFGVTRLVQSCAVTFAMPASEDVVSAAQAEAKARDDAEAGQETLDDELEATDG